MPSFSATVHAEDNTVPPDLDAALTTALEEVVGRRGIHHAVVAIESEDGTQRWSAGSGPAEEEAVPPDAPFFIASITKRFIIALLLQAHERAEVSLDAPITDLLPKETTTGLHVLDGTDRTAAITVRNLASHTSGLPDYFEKRRDGPSLFDRLIAGQDVSWTFEDVLRTTREQQRPHFPPQDLSAPRQKARYSDTGFQLLIRILETATGSSFADLLADRITGPLDLQHTGLPRPQAREALAVAPLPLYAKERVELPSLIRSSNDLISTTEDLLTFQRALLRGDLFREQGTRVLLTERRNRLRNAPVLQYGLGTMFFRVNRLAAPGHRPLTLVGHSGATGTWLFHCPELGVHLAGTVDRTRGQAVPFRVMAKLLRTWRRPS